MRVPNSFGNANGKKEGKICAAKVKIGSGKEKSVWKKDGVKRRHRIFIIQEKKAKLRSTIIRTMRTSEMSRL